MTNAVECFAILFFSFYEHVHQGPQAEANISACVPQSSLLYLRSPHILWSRSPQPILRCVPHSYGEYRPHRRSFLFLLSFVLQGSTAKQLLAKANRTHFYVPRCIALTFPAQVFWPSGVPITVMCSFTFLHSPREFTASVLHPLAVISAPNADRRTKDRCVLISFFGGDGSGFQELRRVTLMSQRRSEYGKVWRLHKIS